MGCLVLGEQIIISLCLLSGMHEVYTRMQQSHWSCSLPAGCIAVGLLQLLEELDCQLLTPGGAEARGQRASTLHSNLESQ